MLSQRARRARPALYYPYIHIRSESWLKASLLCFPAVKRIVPPGYTPEDRAHLARYSEISGVAGPLLQSVTADSRGAREAQHRLLDRLRAASGEELQAFARDADPRERYWIHDAKFAHRLLDFLRHHRLAWDAVRPNAYGHRNWLAMHPVLGKAVMTVLGLSIARSDRLDIVTDTGSFHEALLANDEARVFDAVLGYPALARQPQAIRRDVAEMAICLAGVNLAALRPEHLIELHATKAFRDFQDLLRTTAADVELDADPREYENKLRDAAQSIVDAWGDSRRAIGREAKKALYEQGAAGIVRELWLRGTGAAGTSLKAVAGIFISMVVVKATLAAPKYLHGRRHLLSRVRKAEDRGLLLRYPLGLDR